MIKRKVKYIDKNGKLIEYVIDVDENEELVESYIKRAYGSGQPADLLEDLLKEI